MRDFINRYWPRLTAFGVIILIAVAGLLLSACTNEFLNGGRDPLTNRGDYAAEAIDGDTFVDGRRRPWRLARIDTPELPGHCRPGRECAKGNPYIATAVLAALLSDEPIHCKLVTTDVYGRNIGECYTKSGKNISNEMLRLGVAEEYHR